MVRFSLHLDHTFLPDFRTNIVSDPWCSLIQHRNQAGESVRLIRPWQYQKYRSDEAAKEALLLLPKLQWPCTNASIRFRVNAYENATLILLHGNPCRSGTLPWLARFMFDCSFHFIQDCMIRRYLKVARLVQERRWSEDSFPFEILRVQIILWA